MRANCQWALTRKPQPIWPMKAESAGGDPVAFRVHAALDRMAGDLPGLGIALSGGGDSTALMHLAKGWARGRRLMAATVDHALREGSAEEAQAARRAALEGTQANLALVSGRLRELAAAP